MILKKILTFAVTAAVALAALTAPVSAEGADDAENPNFRLLSGLGVFDGTGVTDPSLLMTGNDFSVSAANLLKGNAYVEAVPREAERVQFAELIKLLIDAAGCGSLAARSGGYPVGYFTQALRLKVINNSSADAGEFLTFNLFSDTAVKMFDVKIHSLDNIGEGFYEYTTNSEDTFLTRIMKLKKLRGQITANEVTSLDAPTGLAGNRIKAGGKIFRLTGKTANTGLMVGRYAEIYYEYDKNDPQDEPFTVYAEEYRNYGIIELDARLITGYSDYTLYYEKGDEVKTVSFAKDAAVLYNGVLTASYDAQTFNIEEGGVVIVKSPSGVNETVIITDYVDFYVSSVDKERYTVYNKLADGAYMGEYKELELDPSESEKHINIYNANGALMNFEELKEGDVLSVAANSSYINVYVSRTQLKRFVASEISEDREYTVISSGAQTYPVTNFFAKSSYRVELEPGKSYNLWINIFGKITYMETVTASDLNPGYLIAVCLAGNTIDKTMKFKIFRSDGAVVDIDGATNMYISDKLGNEPKKMKPEEAYALVNTEAYSEQPVWYRLNGEGLVFEMEFALDYADPAKPYRYHKVNPDPSLAAAYNTHYIYKQQAKTFGGHWYMGSGIIMYDIPSIRTDYDEYTIRASSKLSNNQPYTFDAYSNDPDSVVLNYLVFKGKSRAIEPRAHAMAVTQFSTVTNRDGDILKRVIGIQDGTRVIYDSHLIDGQRSAFDVAKDAFGNTYAIKEGDIIRVSSVPLTGYVDSVQLLYRRDMVNPAYPDSNQGHLVGTTGTFSSDVSNSNPFSVSRNALDTQNVRIYGNGEFKVYYGWVYKKSSSIITVTSQDLSRTQYSADNNEHLTSSFNISIYGKYSAIDYYGPETDARLGTSEDIRAYKDVGSDCTRVMVINFYGEPNQLIVMNGGR